MRTLPQPIAVLLAVAALLALPAAADATLTYTKGFATSRVYYARDNGKGAHLIGPGRDSHASPDGQAVAYERATRTGAEMRLYSVATHKSVRLLDPWTEAFVFAWSPDSTTVAALTGSLNGPQTLLLIDVGNGKRTKIGRGYFNGVSFSPDGGEIVYGVARSASYPSRSDLFRERIDGTGKVALSHDKRSAYPLWGPSGQIVFARQLGAKHRRYGPKDDLFLMSEDGKRISRLTHTEVDPLAQGLTPLAWSEDGARLLTEFGGEDQSYAVAVNARTGVERKLTDNPEAGFVATTLSPDGRTVLGTTGLGFGGNPHPRVVTVPFTGGRRKVLVAGGYEPSWGG